MNMKIVSISVIPSILFMVGIIFLSYSSLTMSKVIRVQNQVFILFFDELKETDLLSAIVVSLEYFFVNVLWIILVFLLVVSSGFLVYLYYIKRVDVRVLVASQVLMIVLVLVLSNFSITMLMTSLSLLLGTVWMWRTFEPEKKIFSTGYSVITSRIGLLSIFMAVGILLSLLVNIKGYEKEMQQTNMDLMKNFMPDVSEAKDAQKKQVEQLTNGLNYVLSEQYEYFPDETKAQCKDLYEGMTMTLDSYKNQTFQKIDEQEISMTESDILQAFPMFNLIVKATPVIIAVSAYALLALLTPIMGFFGGFIYSVVEKPSRAEGIQSRGR